MQAIVTRTLAPTNTRGARAKATCDAGSSAIAWDDALNPEQNHTAAAMNLIRELGWGTYGNWILGSMPGAANSYAFVLETGAERYHALDGRF